MGPRTRQRKVWDKQLKPKGIEEQWGISGSSVGSGGYGDANCGCGGDDGDSIVGSGCNDDDIDGGGSNTNDNGNVSDDDGGSDDDVSGDTKWWRQ